MARKNMSVEDLEFAATWLEAYENSDGETALNAEAPDEQQVMLLRVARHLRREAARRERRMATDR